MKATLTPALRQRPGAWVALLTFLLMGLVGLYFFALFWLVNLDVAAGRWLAQIESPRASSSVGPATQTPPLPIDEGASRSLNRFARALTGTWFGWFERASRDESTVTPLIGLLFFGFVVRGAAQMLFVPDRVAQALEGNPHYPFNPNYQVLWVQLGLFGTLVGFLLVGTRLKAGMPPDQSVTILVVAFGTALLSTLAGVVGAYFAAPPVVLAFEQIATRLELRRPSRADVVADVEQQLHRLERSLGEASRTLAELSADGTAVAPFTAAVAQANQAMINLAEHLSSNNWDRAFEQAMARAIEQLDERQAGRLAQLAESEAAALDALGQTVATAFRALAQEITVAQRAFGESLREGFAGIERQQQMLQATVATQADTTRATQDAVVQRLDRLVASHARFAEALESQLGQLERRLGDVAADLSRRINAVARPRAEIRRLGGLADLWDTLRTWGRGGTRRP